MSKNVAIIGATGAVGKEIIHCLDALKFPVQKLRLVASEKSTGKKCDTPFGSITLEVAGEDVFKESDVAIFSAGGDISKELAPMAKRHNCLVIDNS
ncbi:MAG: Aspartate-semialdehyde dehydrogenase, partial [Candidatus Peregrinibacteria bacterium GW2011_GWA2_47_7]